MVQIIQLADSLDGWPRPDNSTEATTTIQCVGKCFLEFQALVSVGDGFEELDASEREGSAQKPGSEENEDSSHPPAIDLFSLTEKQLEKLNYYLVLNLPYKPDLTPDDVKKAYRKASLKYHPDKSGRGEEDAVFLKVKAAFETLSTQKQAYDSTEMPFDDSLPSESPKDFFKEYESAFLRNLFFDARLLNQESSNGNGTNGQASKKNNKNRRKSKNSQQKGNGPIKPPKFGDANTPVEQVHEFYDYWTHFTSWRDFGLQAARELETQEHLENAESRFEKRWYQKEIDRRAKKLKQQEQARITTLVERAMAIDPRLLQEHRRLKEEKELKQKLRDQEAQEKKRQEEEAKLAEERRIEEEKERRAEEKLQREKEKKMLRKAKQAFRRLVAEALTVLDKKEYALESETDLIFEKLDRDQITKLNSKLEPLSSKPEELFQVVKTKAHNLKNGIAEEGDEDNEEPPVLSPENGSNSKIDLEGKDSGGSTPSESPAPAPSTTASKKAKVPFSKDELSVLAKGIKKYPPGGANRWDQIANYINGVCRPEVPRTKEECIEVFNQSKVKAPHINGNAPKPAVTVSDASDEDVWTEEQDKQLQDGLAQFPTTMDKNERWTNIASGVTGKTKKQCVNRFKYIRDAIKNKK